MSFGPARHLDQYIWFRYLDPRRPNPRRRAGPKLIFRWYGKWCMAQTKLIAPVGCSGEVFVHFAAINPHTCLGLQVLSVSEPLSWSLLRFRRDGISGFRLRFTISRSLISRYLAWSYLGLQVLPESEPLSLSLLRFYRELDFGFPSSVYDFPISDFPWLLPFMSLSLKVLSESEPPSWSLLSFHLQFGISRDFYHVSLQKGGLSHNESPELGWWEACLQT